MDPKKLNKILRRHKLWAKKDPRGKQANLTRFDLSKVNLAKTYLRWADMHGTKLFMADLRKADLRESDLRWSDLTHANLTFANLCKVKLDGATLTNVIGATFFQGDVNIFITQSDWITIGSQCHHKENWAIFSDREIEMMGIDLTAWNKYKETVLFAKQGEENA